jgi:hypothetical protein
MEGGGTHYSQLGITVLSKQGRVLLWPSVMDRHPHHKDSRTDFKTPYKQPGFINAISKHRINSNVAKLH